MIGTQADAMFVEGDLADLEIGYGFSIPDRKRAKLEKEIGAS
jgi:hypothetical protein